jgi:uncharacterized membrane-anchored protein YitT (DUF2179 family)
MLYNTLHNRWLRIIAAVLGELLCAVATAVFIVPQGLYTGGLMGLCQLIRTLLQTHLHVTFGAYDLAGILYFLLNIPILLLAYRTLGRGLVFRTVICTVAFSLFYSLIPIPKTPVVEDMLTSCLLGGILGGVGGGIVLTCGCSGGGLDVVGLCLSKRGSNITVGKFSLGFNAFLYLACLFLFDASVAIYSIIYNFFSALVLDRMHQQNISVQVMIFTRENEQDMAGFIINKLGRGVTWWNGVGAYTGEKVRVLVVCLSKYEIEELRHAVHDLDPHAFLVISSGVQVDGNFPRKLG